MEPKIIEKNEMKFIGCVFYGNPFHSVKGWSIENEIGKLWMRFVKLLDNIQSQIEDIRINPSMSYELHIDPMIAKEENKWYVFIGIEVKEFKDISLEMFCKILPKTTYAIFTAKGEDFKKANDFIYNEWLQKTYYKEAYSYQIQAYDSKRFYGMNDPKSEVDFYIPIK